MPDFGSASSASRASACGASSCAARGAIAHVEISETANSARATYRFGARLQIELSAAQARRSRRQKRSAPTKATLSRGKTTTSLQI
jgi:hypothetical protein